MEPINQTNPEQPITPSPQPIVPPELQPQVVASQPLAQPVVSAAPQPVVAPVQPTSVLPPSPVPQYPVQSANTPKKHKKGLIIGVVIGVVVAVLGVLILLAFPAIQRQALAANFIDDVTAGKVESAVTRTGDSTTKTYLTTAATKLKGETAKYKTSEYNPDSESYYLFDLSGGTYTSARVGVSKEDGKLVVVSFVYDTQQLKLVPSSSSSTTSSTSASTSTTAETTTTTATSTTTCLGASDFSALASYSIDKDSNGLYTWMDNFFFKPDSTEYNYPDIMGDTYAKYKAFYEQQSAKDFTMTISGTVYSASPATALANSRAEKVKQDMISKAGFSASRITVGEPTNSTNQDNEAARNVDITIKSSTTCKSS